MRVGVSSGPLVAGVIGETRRSYDVWGDAVNVASRMESNGAPGRVQISADTYESMAHRGNYTFEPHEVHAKGKGLLSTYFVEQRNRTSQQWTF